MYSFNQILFILLTNLKIVFVLYSLIIYFNQIWFTYFNELLFE